jgi:hypothetical protein
MISGDHFGHYLCGHSGVGDEASDQDGVIPCDIALINSRIENILSVICHRNGFEIAYALGRMHIIGKVTIAGKGYWSVIDNTHICESIR